MKLKQFCYQGVHVCIRILFFLRQITRVGTGTLVRDGIFPVAWVALVERTGLAYHVTHRVRLAAL